MKEDIFSSPSYMFKYPRGSDLVVTSATGTSGVAFGDTYLGGAANQGVVYSPWVKMYTELATIRYAGWEGKVVATPKCNLRTLKSKS